MSMTRSLVDHGRMQRSMPTPAPKGRATQALALLGAVATLVGVTLVVTAEPAAMIT